MFFPYYDQLDVQFSSTTNICTLPVFFFYNFNEYSFIVIWNKWYPFSTSLYSFVPRHAKIIVKITTNLLKHTFTEKVIIS